MKAVLVTEIVLLVVIVVLIVAGVQLWRNASHRRRLRDGDRRPPVTTGPAGPDR